MAKANNGGQICINPDVVYVPREQMEDLIGLLGAAYTELLPATDANPDVVAVVNARHLHRIEGYLQDARQRGARIESFPGLLRSTRSHAPAAAASGDQPAPRQPDHARRNFWPGAGAVAL